MSTAYRPRLFISYSSRDLAVARMLHNRLSSAGFDVWRDERRIERNWSQEIAQQLVLADVAVVLWSGGAAASQWVRHEWLTARALTKQIEMCLLPGHPALPPPLENLRRLPFAARTAAEVQRKAALLAGRLSRPASTSTSYDFSIAPANAHIPFGLNEQFTGRQRDLFELYLTTVGNLNPLGTRHVGLVGMGGVGKTQLAAEFAHRFAFAFEGGVFWIQAADPGRWRSELIAIARRQLSLQLEADDDEKRGNEETRWLRALQAYLRQQPATLLIMDNVPDPEQLNSEKYLVPGLTPLTMGGTLLFTTRRVATLPGVTMRRLDHLEPDDALQLLVSFRPTQTADERAAAADITARLGYLPLAIVLAGGYLRSYRNEVSFARYLALLERNRLAAVDTKAVTREQLATRHEAAVRTTLQSQWAMLRDAQARRLFMLAGQLDEGSIIPARRLAVLAGVRPRERGLRQPFARAMHRLRDLSLIEELEDNAFRQHPLVRDFAFGLVSRGKREALRRAASRNVTTAYTGFPRLAEETQARGVRQVLGDLDLAGTWSGNGRKRSSDSLVLAETLELAANALDASPRELAAQLCARLRATSSTVLKRLVAAGRAEAPKPWLEPLRVSLLEPGTPLLRTLRFASITEAAVTPDGRKAITGSYDGGAAVWELETGQHIFVPTAVGANGVEDLAISGDGRTAVLLAAGELTQVELATGEVTATAIAESHEISSVMAVNHDGTTAIMASYGGQFLVWHPGESRRVEVKRVRGGEVSAYAVSPLAEAAVFGLKNGAIQVHAPGYPVRKLAPPRSDGAVREVVFSPDGTTVVMGWNNGAVARWDAATWTEQWRVTSEMTPEKIAVSRDGTTLLVATDFTLEIRDLKTGTLRGTYETPQSGVLDLAISENGRIALLGSENGLLELVDLRNKRTRWRVKAHGLNADNVHILPRAERGVSASIDGALKVWDLTRSYRSVDGTHEGTVFGVALTPDGRKATTGSEDGSVAFWDIASGRAITKRSAHRGRVFHVGISADGALGCSASADKTVGLWNWRDGALLHRFEGHDGEVHGLAMTPDGSRIVSGSWDHTVRVWDTRDHSALPPLSWHSNWVHEVAISDNGRVALSCDGRPACVVWDVDRGVHRHILETSVGVYHIALSGDGRRAITLDSNGELVVWDTATGDRLQTRQCSGSNPYSLIAMADARCAVADSGADDHGLDVLDLAAAGRLTRLIGHSEGAGGLAFAASGRLVISGSMDNTVRVWNARSGNELCRLTCDFLVRRVGASRDGRTVIAGDDSGAVHLLALRR